MSDSNVIPSPIEIMKQIQAGEAILLDVRRDDEWNQTHADLAVHLPYEDIMNGATPASVGQKKVYLYCVTGGRAGAATEMLQRKGYDAVSIGGLDDWAAGGGTTVQ